MAGGAQKAGVRAPRSHRSVGPARGSLPQPRRHPRQTTRALPPPRLHHGSHKLVCAPARAAHSRALQCTLARSTVVMAHRPPEPTGSAHARAEADARRGGG
eukprot:2557475-Prymnesium_polylepis.1